MNKFLFLQQLLKFAFVGVMAAAMHFSVVVLLVQRGLTIPLIANMFGFFMGFQVSYWGHKEWTFKEVNQSHLHALPRLLIVQLLSFAINESLFYVFLSYHLNYAIALFIVLLIVPVFTFLANKFWVFRLI